MARKSEGKKRERTIRRSGRGSPVIKAASPASVSRKAYRGAGSTGPDATVSRLAETAIKRAGRGGRGTARTMPLRYMAVMIILITAMCAALVYYIKLHADITESISRISNLETQLTDLKAENDETYNEIVNNIDLDAIRDKAVNEYGMKYADSDQVVTYSDTDEDYVHQVSDVNE